MTLRPTPTPVPTPVPNPKRAVTVRLARWSATHTWRAIALWLVFVASCVLAGQLAGLHQASELDTATGQSGQAMRWLHDAKLTAPDTEDVLITARTGAAMNLLSAGAAFGLLTLVFQHHWADGLLGYTSTGRLINWIPLFTFVVLFGLSMDYHVFVINSIREQTARGLSVDQAVRVGVGRSAGTVTAAAIVMVSVFAIFAGLEMVEMKELGVGLAAAVLIDAVVVRAVVLPSLLVLLGDRIRWPGRSAGAEVGTRPRSVVGASSQ